MRAGTASVELALCLPFMALLVFGSIQLATSVYAKQVLTSAAYEAARVGTSLGGTDAAARQRASEIIAAGRVADATITINPPLTATLARGTAVTFAVSAPAQSQSVFTGWSFVRGTLTGQVVMVRN